MNFFIRFNLLLLFAFHLSHADSVRSAFEMAELLQLLAGATIGDQNRLISRYVDLKYNYHLQCVSIFGLGFNEPQCLLAYRAFAQSLALGLLPRTEQKINISISSDWASIRGFDLDRPVIEIPRSARADQMARFVNSQLRSEIFKRYLESTSEIVELRAKLEKAIGVRIEFDATLSRAKIRSALEQVAILRDGISNLKYSTEVLFLGHQFRFSYEQNLLLKEGLDVDASIAGWSEFFNDPRRERRVAFGSCSWPQSFFSNRQSFEKLALEFKEKYALEDVVCSDDGSLTYFRCISTLESFDRWISAVGAKLPPKIVVLVLAKEESSQDVDRFYDSLSGKTIILLKENFRPKAFARFMKLNNWIEGVHQ